MPPPPPKGRAAGFNTPNRFARQRFEPLEIDRSGWDEDDAPTLATVFLKDTSRTILARNDSPDIPFTYSLNPYRGCEHGCIYCYARPSHEYLGFSAGLDFETKILVKYDAPELLAEAFRRKSWKPEMVSVSGNTDCYQPVEKRLQLTRRCLEVFLRFRNPVGILTKNALVARDIDLLAGLARFRCAMVGMSITTLDAGLARTMEPRTAAPHKRLETVAALAAAGIPVFVMTAPIIPGLNDEEMPAILREAASHGAKFASYSMVRLTGPLEPLFVDWLKRELPDRAQKIINRIKDIHGGTLGDSRFGVRQSGEGEIAAMVKKLFTLNCDKYGLNKERFELSTEHFRREERGQMEMF